MPVDEPGKDHSVGDHDLHVGGCQACCLLLRTDVGEAIAVGEYRFSPRSVRVGGEHPPDDEQWRVGGAGVHG